MGDVFKAEHRMMGRTVALKVINRDLFKKPAAVERFQREVKAAARLSHPNIVTADDAEQAGDVHFLVMEYVDGTELARKAKEDGPLPITEATAEKQGVCTSVFWTSVWASGTCTDYLGNLKSRRSG
jgi:serine/threonine protein kinase